MWGFWGFFLIIFPFSLCTFAWGANQWKHLGRNKLIRRQESSYTHLPFRQTDWNVYLKVIKKLKYLVWLCSCPRKALVCLLKDAQHGLSGGVLLLSSIEGVRILVASNSTSEVWLRLWWWILLVAQNLADEEGTKIRKDSWSLNFSL